MVYNYEEKIVNDGDLKDFFNPNRFVGYILPDGTIYECENHNIATVESVIKLSLQLLIIDFNDRDKFLDYDCKDNLIKVIMKYFRKIKYDEVVALNNYIEKNHVCLSDLLVELFGCHLITRLKKEILTSTSNHYCFYNYLLNGYKINTFNRLAYDEESKEFVQIEPIEENDDLYEEINEVIKYTANEDIKVFYIKR